MSNWARTKQVFKRSKVPPEKKILAAMMCASGYSYRDVAKELGGVSYIGVRNAYMMLVEHLPRPEKKRRLVAIDENQSRVNGKNLVLWLARDMDSGEVLSFRCSSTGGTDDRDSFISSVLEYCSERPLLRVGRGPNYPKVLKNLDLHFQIDTTSTFREKIGRWIRG